MYIKKKNSILSTSSVSLQFKDNLIKKNHLNYTLNPLLIRYFIISLGEKVNRMFNFTD